MEMSSVGLLRWLHLGVVGDAVKPDVISA